MKKWHVVLLWLVVLSIFARYRSAAFGGQTEMVRIGVCLSLSGEFQESGRKALAGVRLRVDDFNSRATDRLVELVIRDDRSDAATARALVDELATEERVPAIIGPLATSLMLGMREAADEHKVVLVSPSVTSPKIGHDGGWDFRLLFDDGFQGVALGRFVGRNLGFRRAAAIVNDRLGYSGSVFAAFKENFEKEGGSIVSEQHYNWVASEDDMYDFSEILSAVARTDPDIILLPVNSLEVAAIIRQSTMAGIEARFCGGDTWQHENVLLASGHNLENAYFVSGINFDSGTPEMERFLYLYDHSNDPYAQRTSVLGYDAASLLLKAMENGNDSESIREGLFAIRDFPLATGVISIDRERGSEKTAYIHRINMVDDHFESRIIDEIKP